jgi:hypothetical protein
MHKVAPVTPRLSWRWILAVFMIALLLRAGLGIVRLVGAEGPTALEFPDEQQYWLMAQSLHAGDGLADELGFQATRMPLYPGALSLFAGYERGIVAAMVSHWIVGAVAAALAACLAAYLAGPVVGVIAGLLVAADPFLVFFASLLLTETWFLAALLGLWWVAACLLREHPRSLLLWGLAGLLAALCVYLRESSLGLALAVLALACLRHRSRPSAWIGASLAVAILVAALVPWALRNERVIGEWCWLTTRGGISLYDGVGPQATGASNLGAVKQMPAVRGLSETEWNDYFLRESLRAIRQEPLRMLRLAVVKLGRMWNPLPNVETYQSGFVRVVAAAWSCPIFLLALIGAYRLWTRPSSAADRWTLLLLLLPAAYLSLLHSLFVGSVRYRLGAMPMIEILAALAVVSLARRFRPRADGPETARGR